ncbi:MAG TPA: DUF222 domain-containing protein [Actinomycetota bacterium]|nr:DUF222 domain-containing protein [Actinomycetota bacterium]
MGRESLAGRSTAELADGIEQLHGLKLAVDAQMLEFVAAYDACRGWAEDGSSCMEAWLVARLAWTREYAFEVVRVARALEALPIVAGAYSEGTLSWDQTRALASFATSETEADLVEEARRMSAAHLRRVARRARPVEKEEENRAHRRRKLRLRWDHDGLVLRIAGSLPQAEGAVVERAISRLAETAPLDPETGTYEDHQTRCADALVELASMRLAADPDTDRATVVVHVDADVLMGEPGGGELEGGVAISSEALRRLACDARWQIVAHGPDGRAVGIGRISRTPTAAMVRELRRRDITCRFPGCERSRWVAAHHVKEWALNGKTDLENLILLCGFHHRLVHEGGWRISGDPTHQVAFISPSGRFVEGGPVSLRREVRERILEPSDPGRGPPGG